VCVCVCMDLQVCALIILQPISPYKSLNFLFSERRVEITTRPAVPTSRRDGMCTYASPSPPPPSTSPFFGFAAEFTAAFDTVVRCANRSVNRLCRCWSFGCSVQA
jgi:hypothetical protein